MTKRRDILILGGTTLTAGTASAEDRRRCQTAITLREAGFDARYMAGGHYAWKAAGGKMTWFAQQ